MTRIREEEEV